MRKRIVLAVIAIIIIALGITAYAFRDEISLLYTGLFVSDEKFEQTKTENKEKLSSALIDYGIDPSVIETDVNAPENGENMEPEIIDTPEPEIPEIPEKPEENKPSDEEDTPLTEEEIKKNNCAQAVAKAVDEINTYKAQYSSELATLEAEISLYFYRSLKRTEGLTEAQGKQNVITKYLSQMMSFQKKCDEAVDNSLKELETVLKANDGDTEIIKQIRTEYDNLKKEKLKFYMNKMDM